MIHEIFSIYDSKSEAYLQPFFIQNKATAVRAISNCVNDPDHAFSKHPSDYHLFHLGSFDDDTSLFDLFPSPDPVVKLLEVMQPDLPFDPPFEKVAT